MRPFRLDRRTFLRGAGGAVIALPWLEVMRPDSAHAQGASKPAQRFISVYTPGGTVINKWTPTGSETAPVLSPILAPLAPMKNKLLVLSGLDLKSAVGEQHQAGIIALLTGTQQSGQFRNYAAGPSIDQVIASRFNKPRRSLEIAVRWATGKSHGLLSPINSLNFENANGFAPIPPRLDPVQIGNDLFKSVTTGAQGATQASTNDAAARLERRKSVLDFLDRRYVALSQRLGRADRQKLDQHLTKIREIEKGLGAVAGGTQTGKGVCRAPTLVNTSDYNPQTGRNSSDNGSVKDASTDAAIPKVGKLMMDMIVMAMACDMTSVATLQWSDTEAKHTFPWLKLTEHHHYYQHDGGFKPVECEKICTWYSEMHLYLLQAMAAVDMGGRSLLDESVVFFGSELQEPPSHMKNNMPLLLAGNGGGLRTGRWLKYNGVSHNNLLVSILNLFGDARRTFGDPKHCTGPLTNFT
jgi:hypothetical protein